jgi:site-specific DNA recombinase
MADMEQRLNYLRKLLATQKVDPEDYRRMKAEYTEKIDRLLVKMAEPNQNFVDIEALLRTGTMTLLNLEKLYLEGDIIKKREIIGSIYPEKLTFDGFNYRTARLNEAVSLIYSLGAGFSGQKKQDKAKKNALVL